MKTKNGIAWFAMLLVFGLGIFATANAATAKGKKEIAGQITGTVDASFVKRGDVLVYLEKVPGSYAPQKAAMDQKALRFVPKILPVTVGSTVVFKNSDDVLHNVMSPEKTAYDLGTAMKGKKLTHTFTKPGVYTQLCNLHPEMEAYVVVLQNPFTATVKKNSAGTFVIEKVPAGTYTIKIWGDRLKKKQLLVETTVIVEDGRKTKAHIVAP